MSSSQSGPPKPKRPQELGVVWSASLVGRLLTHAMLGPPVRDAVAAELAGVHAGVQVHIPLVACHVIQTMRNQFANARTGEVVIQRVYLNLREGCAFP